VMTNEPATNFGLLLGTTNSIIKVVTAQATRWGGNGQQHWRAAMVAVQQQAAIATFTAAPCPELLKRMCNDQPWHEQPRATATTRAASSTAQCNASQRSTAQQAATLITRQKAAEFDKRKTSNAGVTATALEERWWCWQLPALLQNKR